MKNITKVVIGALSGLVLTVGMSVPASAHTGVQTWVIDKSKTASVVNRGQVIAQCSVGTSGSTCTISSGKTATRTINYTLGMARALVASSLGISSAETVSISTSCTSPVMSAGQVWKAYPVGDRWSYRIHKRTTTYSNQGVVQSTKNEYSGRLNAFNPYSAGIHCQL